MQNTFNTVLEKYRKIAFSEQDKGAPFVRNFWKFSKAGRQLADLHLNYESVPPAPGVIVLHNPLSVKDSMNALGIDEVKYVDYEVQKMRYPKKGQTETIIYNSRITVDNIPAKAYEYVVNGKSAIDWIMERSR